MGILSECWRENWSVLQSESKMEKKRVILLEIEKVIK